MNRLLVAALCFVSTQALAFEPQVEIDRSQPVMTIVTEHHGEVTFNYASRGKVYSRVSDVPYTGPKVCKGFFWNRTCDSPTLTVMDGVEVTHVAPGICEVVESTVIGIDSATRNGVTEDQPVVSSRRYDVACISRGV